MTGPANEIFPIFFVAFISLAMTLVWCVSKIGRRTMFYVASLMFGLTVAISFSFYAFFIRSYVALALNGLPIELIPLLTIIASLIIGFFGFEKVNVFSTVAFLLNALLLLVGFECLKSSGNTWGNFSLFVGVYLCINTIVALQLLTYFSEKNLFYAIVKLLIGVVSFALILLFGIGKGDPYWVGDSERMARYGLLFASFALFLEGLMLIYKSRKTDSIKPVTSLISDI